MVRKCILLFFLIGFLRANAQQEIQAERFYTPNSKLRISLLTCGVGNELVEILGHSAIRIIDSSKTGQLADLVYNYGTVNYTGAGFEMQLIKGSLLYYLGVYPYDAFLKASVHDSRSLQEHVLLLSEEQKLHLAQNLAINAMSQNKYYHYDFFFDDCSSRIRDMLLATLGNKLQFGETSPAKAGLTFRGAMNPYFSTRHWEGVGSNILLGSRVDKKMSNEEAMFLPFALMEGVAGAKLNGMVIAAPPILLKPAPGEIADKLNMPFIVGIMIAVLTFLGTVIRRYRRLGTMMCTTLFMVTGALGILILFMWFGTEHQGCKDNFNLLWAIPFNILLPFLKAKMKSIYVLIAMLLLGISLLLHIAGIQVIPVFELTPLFFALLLSYGSIYRGARLPIEPIR